MCFCPSLTSNKGARCCFVEAMTLFQREGTIHTPRQSHDGTKSGKQQYPHDGLRNFTNGRQRGEMLGEDEAGEVPCGGVEAEDEECNGGGGVIDGLDHAEAETIELVGLLLFKVIDVGVERFDFNGGGRELQCL